MHETKHVCWPCSLPCRVAALSSQQRERQQQQQQQQQAQAAEERRRSSEAASTSGGGGSMAAATSVLDRLLHPRSGGSRRHADGTAAAADQPRNTAVDAKYKPFLDAWDQGFMEVEEEPEGYYLELVQGEVPRELHGTLFRRGSGMQGLGASSAGRLLRVVAHPSIGSGCAAYRQPAAALMVPHPFHALPRRNGPGRFSVGGEAFQHPYDGDGLILSIAFQDGRAFFRSRFVRTAE